MARQFLNLVVGKKSLNFDDAAGTFSGYGSVFGNEDLNGDIVERGAYTKTIQTATQSKGRTPFLWPLLWMHDMDNPVGGIISAKEDSKGLLITAQCDLDTEMGRRAFSGLKMGYMSGLSIGYNPVKFTRDTQGVRHLTEIKLMEISVITTGFAANPLATVDAGSVKSQSGKGSAMSKSQSEALFEQMFKAMLTEDSGKPRRAAVKVGPQREDYASDAAYEKALMQWHAAQVVALQRAAQEAQEKVVLDAQLARKVASGLASLAELREYHQSTGQTQHGVRVDNDALRERVERGYEAMEITLEKARKGLLPEGW